MNTTRPSAVTKRGFFMSTNDSPDERVPLYPQGSRPKAVISQGNFYLRKWGRK